MFIFLKIATYLYKQNGVLFSHLKEWDSVIWGNMGKLGRHYIKCNKSGTEREDYIFILIYKHWEGSPHGSRVEEWLLAKKDRREWRIEWNWLAKAKL